MYVSVYRGSACHNKVESSYAGPDKAPDRHFVAQDKTLSNGACVCVCVWYDLSHFQGPTPERWFVQLRTKAVFLIGKIQILGSLFYCKGSLRVRFKQLVVIVRISLQKINVSPCKYPRSNLSQPVWNVCLHVCLHLSDENIFKNKVKTKVRRN